MKSAVAYGAALLLVHSLGGCTGQSASPDQRDPEPAAAEVESSNAPLVIAFGDSLVAGYGLAPGEGLAPALDRSLERRGIVADVVNAGVSGDTTAAGLRRLGFTLDGQPRKPALVIVALGANDMLRGLAPSQTRANLAAILAELKQRGIPAMLSGMVAAPNMGPDYAREFNVIYAELANEYDVPLYPFTLDGVVGQRALILADGLHPNARGVEVMADRLGPVVGQALGEPSG